MMPQGGGTLQGKQKVWVLCGVSRQPRVSLGFPVVDPMLWALCRYEDEIRLCSGMEFTFMELKKVSRRGKFPSGLALPSPAQSGKGLEVIQAQLVWDRTGSGEGQGGDESQFHRGVSLKWLLKIPREHLGTEHPHPCTLGLPGQTVPIPSSWD